MRGGVRQDSVSRLPVYPLLVSVHGSAVQDIIGSSGGCHHPGDLPVLWYCVLVIRARTYEYAQGRMSIHVYCVLVVRAWTYEYGLNQMYVGGFFTGNRPPVFPP